MHHNLHYNLSTEAKLWHWKKLSSKCQWLNTTPVYFLFTWHIQWTSGNPPGDLDSGQCLLVSPPFSPVPSTVTQGLFSAPACKWQISPTHSVQARLSPKVLQEGPGSTCFLLPRRERRIRSLSPHIFWDPRINCIKTLANRWMCTLWSHFMQQCYIRSFDKQCSPTAKHEKSRRVNRRSHLQNKRH